MPSRRVRRRLFQRIVIWDPASGSIINLPTRYVLSSGASPSQEEEYAQLASGSKTPTRRTSSVQIPLTHKELALFGEVIQRSRCPVKAAFISANEGDNWLWLEETRLQIRDPEVGPGQNAPKVIDLESKVFHPAIWESNDLVGGVPFQNTELIEDQDRGGDFLKPINEERKGYRGPLWKREESSSGDPKVDLAGNYQDPGETRLRFEFPIWGAEVSLETLLGFQLNNTIINALSWSRSVIATSSDSLIIPEETWEVEVRISDSTARPKLVVSRAGLTNAVVYAGGVTPDCSPVKDPDWTPIPEPNEPPEWKQKEDLVYGLNNNPPTWTNSNDYEVSEGTGDSGGNNPPTWTGTNDYETNEENTGDGNGGSSLDYQAPNAGSTQNIYTANGGFSRFNSPPDTSGYQNYADSGQLAIAHDNAENLIFAGQDSSIEKFDLGGNSQGIVISNSGVKYVGIAVDPIANKVYFSLRDTVGIYKMDYDGSNESKITSDAGKNYALGVASDGGNGGYVFGVSKDEREIVRWDLDGSNKTVLKPFESLKTPARNIHLHLEKSYVFYQQYENSNENNPRRINFDGSGDVGLFLSVASGATINDRTYFTVLQNEEEWISIEEVEGGSTNLERRDLSGNLINSKTLSGDFDTGKYLMSRQTIEVPTK